MPKWHSDTNVSTKFENYTISYEHENSYIPGFKVGKARAIFSYQPGCKNTDERAREKKKWIGSELSAGVHVANIRQQKLCLTILPPCLPFYKLHILHKPFNLFAHPHKPTNIYSCTYRHLWAGNIYSKNYFVLLIWILILWFKIVYMCLAWLPLLAWAVYEYRNMWAFYARRNGKPEPNRYGKKRETF